MSISYRNSSNTSFYERHGRRASLLCHPAGLELLEKYKVVKAREERDPDPDKEFALRLAHAIQPVIRKKEQEISSTLLKCIEEQWYCLDQKNSSVSGKNHESVHGKLGRVETSGKPDGVIWLTGLFEKERQRKKVHLIIEVSVDKNGGEKKMGQAFDYASLIKDPSNTLLLFTFHVDRHKTELGISQEVFIYLQSEIEEERKMGFLWREIYEQGKYEKELKFLKKSCEGIVRCLECALHNRDAQVIYFDTSNWTLVSDNVAIVEEEGKKKVLKIFDNRHRPTFRRPDAWLKEKRNWIQSLNVSKRFEFQESSNLATLATLGTPDQKRNQGANEIEYERHTPYCKGSILVIEYEYQNGTHYASRVSHFLDIAVAISEMHECNIVHGDICGFNMLHPHPEAEGITNSILIDFDLSGEVEKDVYPPGYSKNVPDNLLKRSGEAGKKLKFEDDWRELASVMSNYDSEVIQRWRSYRQLCYDISKDAQPVKLLKDFIGSHGDLVIAINIMKFKEMEDVNLKGTGSPNKLLQTPRGSISVEKSEG